MIRTRDEKASPANNADAVPTVRQFCTYKLSSFSRIASNRTFVRFSSAVLSANNMFLAKTAVLALSCTT